MSAPYQNSPDARATLSTLASTTDPEKLPSPAVHDSRQNSATMLRSTHSTTEITYGRDDSSEVYETHMFLILLHLSSTAPLVSLLFALYAIIATILLFLLSPISLCSQKDSFTRNASAYLSPILRTQLRLIYSPNVEYQHAARFLPVLTACLLGPAVAFCIMLTAWVVGVFWAFVAVIGDPTQKTGRRQDEGRNAARVVRRWWEGFLLWGA